MDLFSREFHSSSSPLADRMRPRTIEEFIGQDHIVGPGRLLRRVIQADQLSSLIFYGPPGTGKTTLARVIAGSTKSRFITLNAVLSGVKQLRESIDEARQKLDFFAQRTILFVDEVHRWNKAQQDALLPWVENGTVVLIGATTENPYFEVNSALLSRSRIFQLKPLGDNELYMVARSALTDPERGYGKYRVKIEQEALDHLVGVASGDARTLLNALELAVETTPPTFPPAEGDEIHISLDVAEQSIQRKAVLYDKEGDYHFDTISAFIKSIRGSDPDAALYWLARMIKAGEDPRFIFRRMLISAAEDVGPADPQALVVVQAAAAAFDRVGLPEGQFHLAEGVIYLATAPKSNSCLGYFDALKALDEEQLEDIPNHLRDASRDAQGFGHGQGYLYPHAYRDHWVAQHYLPPGLAGRVFYSPSEQGYEGTIRPLLQQRREEQLSATIDEPPELLTASPGDKRRAKWALRTESGAPAFMRALRNDLFDLVRWHRHWRVLDIAPGSGLFMSEALRRSPEGEVVVCEPDAQRVEFLRYISAELGDWEQPRILEGAFPEVLTRLEPEMRRFELITGRDIMIARNDRKEVFRAAADSLNPSGHLILAEVLPAEGVRLSELLESVQMEPGLLNRYLDAEREIYRNRENPLVNWNVDTLSEYARDAGFDDIVVEKTEHGFTKTISATLINAWFDQDSPGFAAQLRAFLSIEDVGAIKEFAHKSILGGQFAWRRTYALFRGTRRGG